MNYVGIDLHRRSVVIATEDDQGKAGTPQTFSCTQSEKIAEHFKALRPFTAVIEASCSYRWLYDLLSPLGTVVLAHPLRLRAIVSGKAKTDKLDAALLAKLLRGGLIPQSYVPPPSYQELREITRARSRLVSRRTQAKNELHAILSRTNTHLPYKQALCKAGLKYIEKSNFGFADNLARDELMLRIEHFNRAITDIDATLETLAKQFPICSVLMELPGIGLYSALLIIGEIGEPWRFPDGRRVGAYAGLTARVNQSGGHEYYGHITRQGSSHLRWILVEASMMLVRKDEPMKNFYGRIRKRSSAKIARVAAARKLADICWKRLMTWHYNHDAAKAA